MAEVSVTEPRERLAAQIAGQVSNLITDPGEELSLFERLCQETLAAMPTGWEWRALCIKLSPDSAFNPVKWQQRAEWQALRADLQAAWQDWPAAYAKLLALNPRLEVADLLSEISETHISSSWPSGWEDGIEDWVLTGSPASPPFDVRNDTDIARIHARLRDLQTPLGGWIWWSETEKRVVYGDRAAWAKERTRLATLRQEVAEGRKKVAAFLEAMKAQPHHTASTTEAGGDSKRSPPAYHPMQQFRIKPKADPV